MSAMFLNDVFLNEGVFRILLFEGVALFLLAAVVVCHRLFRQPIDRIRLTQAGLALVAIAALCIGFGIGPTWSVVLPKSSEMVVLQEIALQEVAFQEVGRRPPGGDVRHENYMAAQEVQETFTAPGAFSICRRLVLFFFLETGTIPFFARKESP